MFKISDDKLSMDVRINATLSPKDVETLIADLAGIRANMLPAVPIQRSRRGSPAKPSPNVSLQRDPFAYVRVQKNGDIRFWFRHAGIGWLAYDVPVGKAQVVRDYLVANTPAGHAGPTLFIDDTNGGNIPH